MNKRSAIKPRLGNEAETRLFQKLFEEPQRLRKRLVLAIALAPPKARKSRSGPPRPGGVSKNRR